MCDVCGCAHGEVRIEGKTGKGGLHHHPAQGHTDVGPATHQHGEGEAESRAE